MDIKPEETRFLPWRLARRNPLVPVGVRRVVGYQIERVQRGLDPDDWKPMKTVGPGAREIRDRETSGTFRIIYIATFADTVYVLHAFHKRSQTTSKRDLELPAERLKRLIWRPGQ